MSHGLDQDAGRQQGIDHGVETEETGCHRAGSDPQRRAVRELRTGMQLSELAEARQRYTPSRTEASGTRE